MPEDLGFTEDDLSRAAEILARTTPAPEVITNEQKALRAAKEKCLAVCAPFAEQAAQESDPVKKLAFQLAEERLHKDHAEELAAAYFAFSGQRAEDSNPAAPGAKTPLQADVVVVSETAT